MAALKAQLGTSSRHLPALGVSPGLLDTLIAIAGAPRALVVTSMPDTVLATFYNREDSIAVSSVIPGAPRHTPARSPDGRTRISPDWVIAHEFGHRYDYNRNHKPCKRWAPDVTLSPATNRYANENSQERFAEAFANAIDYLRYTSSIGGHDMQSVIDREWYVPGTFQVVQLLLRHPVYRRHPLARGSRHWQ